MAAWLTRNVRVLSAVSFLQDCASELLYPLLPIVFCLTCAYLFYSSVVYTGFGALLGMLVLAAGLPLLMLARRGEGRPAEWGEKA